jgi:hypothetical protein
LTGAKVREEIYQAFEMIYPVLQGLSSHPRYTFLYMLILFKRFPQGLRYHLILGHLALHISSIRRV